MAYIHSISDIPKPGARVDDVSIKWHANNPSRDGEVTVFCTNPDGTSGQISGFTKVDERYVYREGESDDNKYDFEKDPNYKVPVIDTAAEQQAQPGVAGPEVSAPTIVGGLVLSRKVLDGEVTLRVSEDGGATVRNLTDEEFEILTKALTA